MCVTYTEYYNNMLLHILIEFGVSCPGLVVVSGDIVPGGKEEREKNITTYTNRYSIVIDTMSPHHLLSLKLQTKYDKNPGQCTPCGQLIWLK